MMSEQMRLQFNITNQSPSALLWLWQIPHQKAATITCAPHNVRFTVSHVMAFSHDSHTFDATRDVTFATFHSGNRTSSSSIQTEGRKSLVTPTCSRTS